MGRIVLNKKQLHTRSKFLNKLESKQYKVTKNSCLCKADEDMSIGTQDRYDIPLKTVICKNCGLVRSDPYYTQETLKSFYENEYRELYTSSNEATSEFFTQQVGFGEKIVKYLKKHANISVTDKKVYEIGCGAGGILKGIQNSGAKVYGCDYGKDYLEKGKKEGITLLNGDANVLKKFGKADIIVLNHVVEHFLNPIEELKKIKDLLSDDGYLYVSVPGLMVHSRKYGSLRWYLQNAHVYSFTLKTLEYVLNIVGFELLHGDEDVRGIFRKKKVEARVQSRFSNIFLGIFLFLSYHIPVVFDLYNSLRKTVKNSFISIKHNVIK